MAGLRRAVGGRVVLGQSPEGRIAIGSEDSLGGEKSVRTLAEKYIERSKLTDVEVIIYADARHEIFNETNKEEVISDLVAWLDGRLAKS